MTAKLDARSRAWIDRPKLASYAATISQIWATIEFELSICFVILSGSNSALGAAFATVTPIHTRLQMLSALVSRFLEEDDREKYQKIEKQIKKMSTQRNRIIHGLWNAKKGEPDIIYLTNSYPLTISDAEPVAYRRGDFERLTLSFESLRVEMSTFRSHLSSLAKSKPFPRSLPVRKR